MYQAKVLKTSSKNHYHHKSTKHTQIQLLRLLRPSFATGNAQDAAAMVGSDEGASGGGGGGLEAVVVREFPASGVLAYLNPLSYRANAQPPARCVDEGRRMM